MILVYINWEQCQKFMIDGEVFVEETPLSWKILIMRNNGPLFCEKMKVLDDDGSTMNVDNTTFVDRYLLKENIHRVPKIQIGMPIKLKLENDY